MVSVVSMMSLAAIAVWHTCIQLVRAKSVVARSAAACVYIEPKIYCYGGRLFRRDESGQLGLESDIFNSLDLFESRDLATLQNSWEAIPHEDPEANFDCGIVAVPDYNAIFMDGGAGKDNPDGFKSKYNTTIYMIDDEQWKTDIESRSLHTAGHNGILGPDNTIYLWGGASYPDITQPQEPVQYVLEMFFFDFETLRWSTGPGVPSYQLTREWSKAALGNDGMSIYFVGGQYPSAPRYENMTRYFYEASPMNQVLIFDIRSQEWRTQNTTGPTPSTRIFHSLTLKPNTGELILFGGIEPINMTEFREDYFYLLDPENMEWSTRDLGAHPEATYTIAAVHGHSAILVDNDLFIMFGTISGRSTSDVRVLDTESWSWRASIRGLQVLEPTDTPSDTDSSGSETSPGTITGAVIGSVGGAAIIGAIIVFYWLRKRRAARSKQEAGLDVDTGGSRKEDQEHDVMENPISSGGANTNDKSATKTSTHDKLNRENASKFYGAEKPDGAPRFVMTPVKPDGA